MQENDPQNEQFFDYTPFEPVTEPPIPVREPQLPEKEPPLSVSEPPQTKKKDPLKKKLIAFGAVILAVCLVMSFLSGALGSYLVLSFYPLKNLTAATEPAEKVFVPDYAEPETDAAASEQEVTAAEPSSAVQEQSTATEPQTTAPVQETLTLTKGEIYAQAVNSIVCVEALSEKTYAGFFGRTYTQQYSSLGSGFFVSENGFILTNYHVVEGAKQVKVTTYDGTEYPAAIIGCEASNDIAVLKAEGSFSAVAVGDSSALRVGDDVLVIGNALGELSYTFTDGVVSYLSRAVSTESGSVINMFQTNAAINEGNSGGPVYNMNGEVVGIASAKYASASVEGLGFCIPINDVLGMVSDIIDYGYVTGKPSMGVSLQTVTTSMSYSYNIPTGCYIVAVGSGTAADTAGLTAQSVITYADDTRVNTCGELAAILSGKKAGDTLAVTYTGSLGTYTVTLTLDEYRPAEARTNYSNVQDY